MAQFGAAAQLNNPQSFKSLVEAVKDYAIFLLDRDGNVQTWNAGAERIKGYSASEIIGKHFSIFYPQEAMDRNWPAQELEMAARDGRFEDEGWRLRKDGTKFWANVVITALRDGEGNLFGFAKVTRDMTQRLRDRQKLEESKRRLEESEIALRQLSLSLLRAQDQERGRIGRDLHDTIGQYLVVLKLKLDQMASAGGATSPAAECSNLVDHALKEVRTISYLLYPPMLDENGLRSATHWFVEGFSERSGIQTTVNIPDSLPRLPADYELALFRVLQESLTNVHRHSGSATAHVRISINADAVVLAISDRGKGMPERQLEHAGQPGTVGSLGVGLRGMAERIQQLNGILEVTSIISRGTTVTATVPLPAKFGENK